MCKLDIDLFSEQLPSEGSPGFDVTTRLYPVNAMRNRANLMADTEVWLNCRTQTCGAADLRQDFLWRCTYPGCCYCWALVWCRLPMQQLSARLAKPV